MCHCTDHIAEKVGMRPQAVEELVAEMGLDPVDAVTAVGRGLISPSEFIYAYLGSVEMQDTLRKACEAAFAPERANA